MSMFKIIITIFIIVIFFLIIDKIITYCNKNSNELFDSLHQNKMNYSQHKKYSQNITYTPYNELSILQQRLNNNIGNIDDIIHRANGDIMDKIFSSDIIKNVKVGEKIPRFSEYYNTDINTAYNVETNNIHEICKDKNEDNPTPADENSHLDINDNYLFESRESKYIKIENSDMSDNDHYNYANNFTNINIMIKDASVCPIEDYDACVENLPYDNMYNVVQKYNNKHYSDIKSLNQSELINQSANM